VVGQRETKLKPAPKRRVGKIWVHGRQLTARS